MRERKERKKERGRERERKKERERVHFRNGWREKKGRGIKKKRERDIKTRDGETKKRGRDREKSKGERIRWKIGRSPLFWSQSVSAAFSVWFVGGISRSRGLSSAKQHSLHEKNKFSRVVKLV